MIKVVANPYQNMAGLPTMNQTLFKRIESSIDFYRPFDGDDLKTKGTTNAPETHADGLTI